MFKAIGALVIYGFAAYGLGAYLSRVHIRR